MDLPKTGSIRSGELETINIILENISPNETLLQFLNRFRSKLSKSENLVYQFLRPPFDLFQFLNNEHQSIDKLNDRVYLVHSHIGKFIYKYDEQRNANSLSFITSLFAKACHINTPNLILANLHDFDFRPKYVGKDRSVQIMDYLPNWQDYSMEHPRGDNFVPQLASLLAFDLVIGNGDRFLFIFRKIDNILFVKDPEYEQMDLWFDPIINEGNFGFVNSDLWSLDCRSSNLEYILKIHRLLDKEFLKECTQLMSLFFKLDRNEAVIFEIKLNTYLARYMKLFPRFVQLYHLI